MWVPIYSELHVAITFLQYNIFPRLRCAYELLILIWVENLLPANMLEQCTLRATSHTRLRARDHYSSSTLIGGKGTAGPSSLHTTLEGPTE